MKTQLLPALKLTLVTIVFLAILYPALIWGVAQFAGPNKGQDIELQETRWLPRLISMQAIIAFS